jgi:hypothetical protein
MAAEVRDTNGCEQLQKAVNDKNVKIKPMQTGQMNGKECASYFIEILSDLNTDPCTYLKTVEPETKCTLIAPGVKDDEDGLVWDWYVLNCPTGPPCLFLENL